MLYRLLFFRFCQMLRVRNAILRVISTCLCVLFFSDENDIILRPIVGLPGEGRVLLHGPETEALQQIEILRVRVGLVTDTFHRGAAGGLVCRGIAFSRHAAAYVPEVVPDKEVGTRFAT